MCLLTRLANRNPRQICIDLWMNRRPSKDVEKNNATSNNTFEPVPWFFHRTYRNSPSRPSINSNSFHLGSKTVRCSLSSDSVFLINNGAGLKGRNTAELSYRSNRRRFMCVNEIMRCWQIEFLRTEPPPYAFFPLSRSKRCLGNIAFYKHNLFKAAL